MAQVGQLLLSKFTLGSLNLPLVSPQQLQDLSHVSQVVLPRFAEDEDIIEKQ